MDPMEGKEIAVVGTGIAGLSAAWSLAKQGAKVTIYERSDVLGGHAFTFKGEGDRPDVDLGFQVMNLTTYPYLTQFFEEIGVDTEPSDMSFSLSVDDAKLEWSSLNLFAQKMNACSPAFLKMISEVMRFSKEAEEVLSPDSKFASATLGEYLDARKYSNTFKFNYLLPMTAAVWSVPNSSMMDFPVLPLIQFWRNHHLLDPLGPRPTWRVVKEGSGKYVKRVAQALKEMHADIKLNFEVSSVQVFEDRVQVTAGGVCNTFDQVIMACHSDQSASIVKGDLKRTQEDIHLLEKIQYQMNDVFLHSDENQMPRAKSAWASWNVLDRRDDNDSRNVCVTYWLNHLQNLPSSSPLLLCTLNPIEKIDPAKIVFETKLAHPVFNLEAIEAQKEMNSRMAAGGSDRRCWFAGAWLGSGFHEDGIRSAVAVVTSMEGFVPEWAMKAGAPAKPGLDLIFGPSPKYSWKQTLGLKLFDTVCSRGITKGYLRIVLPCGNERHYGNGDGPIVKLRLFDLEMLFKCVRDSDIGLGEAYMDRMFETDNLVGIFDLLIANHESLRQTLTPQMNAMGLLASVLYKIGNMVHYVSHLSRDNTVSGSRANIEEHYDLGNAMYKLFLDDTMTYSSGIHTAPHGAELPQGDIELDLKAGQLAKMDKLIERAGITSSDTVLEIGCGWGSFAIRAVEKTGCKIVGITISTEQLEEARQRVKATGLEDRITLVICDYRKLGMKDTDLPEFGPGSFDCIVSIEMLEAVGHDHLPEYFETVERMLKPNGKAVIQVISMVEERYEEYRSSSSDFIRKFIFPGGHLPSLGAVKWACEKTSLRMDDVTDFGPDYAITLRMWRENFIAKKKEILGLGYPIRFFRCFEMYFAYCESAFKNKYIHNYHYTFTKTTPSAIETPSRGLSSHMLFPGFIAFVSWIASLALFSHEMARQASSSCVASVVFATVVSECIRVPACIDSSRIRHKYRRIHSSLLLSMIVVITVVCLLAFHDVLYTTTGSSNVVFCNWTQVDDCANEIDDEVYIRSPMHFVAGVLNFAATARFLLEMNLMNMCHASGLMILQCVALSSDGDMATSALALSMVHGVSEVHSGVRQWRQMNTLCGSNMADSLYRVVWLMDVVLLVVIRWIPVAVLLFPVILRVNSVVLVGVVLIAIRETSILLQTITELRNDLENSWNTQTLLKDARSRDELLHSLVGSSSTFQSGIYHGRVFHRRKKLEGFSKVEHHFKFNVWMALIDLEEVSTGMAFRSCAFIGINQYWKPFSWHRKDYFDSHSGVTLDKSIKNLVQAQFGTVLDGPILLLTNLRCMGYGFNPVSIYYCLNQDRSKLECAVLEVSNTPWLEKRMYVLPFFLNPQDTRYTWKWQKDFHVSPLIDMFHDYEWKLTLPKDTIRVKATSTRNTEANVKHTTGDCPTIPVTTEGGEKTFLVGLNLERSKSAWRQCLFQPLNTLSILLYIHVHAGILMIMKRVPFQTTPSTSPYVGLRHLFRHLLLFTLAVIYEMFMFPFKKLRRTIS